MCSPTFIPDEIDLGQSITCWKLAAGALRDSIPSVTDLTGHPDGQTITETGLSPSSPTRDQVSPMLTLVYHRRPEFVGLRTPVPTTGPVRICRGATTFGDGVLADSRLSREHAEVYTTGGRVFCKDVGSRNGTRVNGLPVGGPHELTDGDIISAGRELVLYHRSPIAFQTPDHNVMLGRGWRLAEVLAQIRAAAPLGSPVLILGESGTGKELVAQELHRASGSRGQLAAMNCAAVAENLLQSELFGHVKGAFTGADRASRGLIATARGGTVFLDEVGDASPAFQASLLRVLETGEVRPVGATQAEPVDVRFVAATHQDLRAMVETGRFRLDLMTRLSRWVIRLPALRERKEDLPTLALAFAQRRARRPVRLSQALVSALLQYDWPGNIRELDGIIERVVVQSGDEDVLALPIWLEEALKPAAPRVKTEHTAAPTPRAAKPGKEELVAAFAASGGNARKTAERLGVNRSTLYRWLADVGLSANELRRAPGDT